MPLMLMLTDIVETAGRRQCLKGQLVADMVKNPFKQMKQVKGAMAAMMYEIYLAGMQDGRNGGKMPPLKAFCKYSKDVHRRGQAIAMRIGKTGEADGTRTDKAAATEKSG